MIHYTDDRIKKVQAFYAYAKFLCNRFDIEIVLDSNKAETDGRTIWLPNVAALSDRELEMMYSILLHEVGHILYSSFTAEDFKKIKTKAMAFLTNCVEDARIENLLMIDYGGAQNIFSQLYSDYAVDKNLKRRIFGMGEKERPTLFYSLGFYMHNRIVKCDTAPFARQVGYKRAKQIREFNAKYNLDAIIDDAPMNNWDDVVALSEKVYQIFANEYPDKSKKYDFAAEIAAKDNVQKALEDLLKNVEHQNKVIEQKKVDLDQEYINLQNWQEDHAEEIEDLNNSIAIEQHKVNTYNDTVRTRKNIDSLEQSLIGMESKKAKYDDKTNKIKGDISALENKINSKVNPRGKDYTQQQLENLQKTLDNKNSALVHNEQQLDKINKRIEDTRETIKSLEVLDAFPHLNNDEIQEKIDAIKEIIGDFNNDLKELYQQQQKIADTINRMVNNIEKLEDALRTQMINSLFKQEQDLKKHGIDTDILPLFNETPGWDAADAAQREFDEKASKETNSIVRNGGEMGGEFGHNVRDMILYIEDQVEKVKNIDLAELFSEQIGVSKMESVNGIHVNETSIDQSTQTILGSHRPFLALTNEFDGVKLENIAKEKDLLNMQREHGAFINKIKQVFLKKLKFTKKDRFYGGKEEGSLDARNLWKIPTRSGDDYFEINDPKMINRTTASVLIDVSGSQDTNFTKKGEYLQVLAYAFSNALSSVHIAHEVVGYHAPLCEEMYNMNASEVYARRVNSLENIVYKQFNQKTASGIANLKIQPSDNSDSESIRAAMMRLRKQRSKNKMLFIITDCKPFLSNGDISVLDADLQKVIREAKAQKVQVFAFGFEPHGKEFYGKNFCYIQKFDDVIAFCNAM